MYYGTPPIVTNGLMLHLDSLNPQSLPYIPTINNIRSQSGSMAATYTNLATMSISWSADNASWYVTFKSGSTSTNYKGLWPTLDKNSPYVVLEPTSSNVVFSYKMQAVDYPISMSLDLNNNPFSGSSAINDNRSFESINTVPILVTTSSAVSVVARYTVQTGSANFTGSYYYTFNSIYAVNGFPITQDTTVRIWDIQHELSNFQTPFTATSRSIWYDLSGNNYHANLTASARPIPQFSSSIENSLYFDGSGSYCTMPDGAYTNFGSGDFTFSTWLNITTSTTGFIFGSQTTNTFFMYFGAGGGLASFVYGRGNIGTDGTFSNINFPSNVWRQIMFIKSNNTMSLYTNGQLVGQQPNTSSYSQGTSNFIIGKNPNSPITWYNGRMANYMIYNRALSQQEILQNYNAGKTRFGLI